MDGRRGKDLSRKGWRLGVNEILDARDLDIVQPCASVLHRNVAM